MENRIPENKSFNLVIGGKEETTIFKYALLYGLLIFSLITTALLKYRIFYIPYFLNILIISSFVIYIFSYHRKNYECLRLKSQEERQTHPLLVNLKLKNFWAVLAIILFANLMTAPALYATGQVLMSFILFFLVVVAQSTIIPIRDLLAGRKLSVAQIIASITTGTIVLFYLYKNQFRIF